MLHRQLDTAWSSQEMWGWTVKSAGNLHGGCIGDKVWRRWPGGMEWVSPEELRHLGARERIVNLNGLGSWGGEEEPGT